MPVEIADAYVALYAQMPGVQKDISDALGSSNVQTAVAGSGRTIGGSLVSGLGSIVKGGAIAVGAVAAAGLGVALTKGFSRLRSIDDAKAKLSGLGHEASSVDQIMQNALASVRGTAYGMDAAATVAASTVAAGVAPGQDLERTLKLVADAATIAGTDMSSMGSIFNKVATSNKIQGDTIAQLSDSGIPVVQFLAKQLGITGEEVVALASKGEISFAQFQDAMQEGLGGAALSSGKTFSGALDNVFAALSRVGAGLLGGVFPKIAPLFSAITTALGPVEDQAAEIGAAIGTFLGPWIDRLTLWVSAFDITPVVAAVREFYLGAVDVKDLLATGFTENETLLPMGVVRGLQGAHEVIVGLVGAVSQLIAGFRGQGEMAGFSVQAASIGDSLTALQPALAEFGSQLPNVGQAVITIAGAALPVLSGALGFLADNVDTIIAFMPAIVAGFLLWRAASAASATATFSLRTAELAMVPVTFANNVMRLTSINLEGRAAKQKLALAGATATGSAATAASTAGLVGQKVATIASTVATRAAAAGQWLLNAAMTANPIGIVVAAIAALVAGLVWFFTQTELGQDIWANFTQFLGEAWTNVTQWISQAWQSAVDFFVGVYEQYLKPVIDGIGAAFQWLYDNIIYPVIFGIMLYVGLWAALFQWLYDVAVKPALEGIGALFTWLYENAILPAVTFVNEALAALGAAMTWLWVNVIQPAIAGIGEAFNWIYQNVIVPVVDLIIGYFNLWAGVMLWLWNDVISPTLAALGAGFQWVYDNVIRPVTDGIAAALNWVGETVNSVFSGIGEFIGNAFQSAFDLARGPLNSLIDLINGLIGGLNSIRVEIPDWVPVTGGETFSLNIPTIPRLAEGGIVSRRPGGIFANIGEGAYDEAVIPLSPQVLAGLSGGTAAATATPIQVTQEIHGGDGVSAGEVARIAEGRLAYALRGAR